jgi:hypothetical protein
MNKLPFSSAFKSDRLLGEILLRLRRTEVFALFVSSCGY